MLLSNLKNYLEGVGLTKEAAVIDFLKQKQNEVRELNMLFQLIGLEHGNGDIVDLINAASFLQTGISSQNLFQSGLVFLSLIPGYQNGRNISTGKATKREIVLFARKFSENIDSVRPYFSRLKSTQVKKRLKMLPGGFLLSRYSDRMLKTLQQWANALVDSTLENGLVTYGP